MTFKKQVFAKFALNSFNGISMTSSQLIDKNTFASTNIDLFTGVGKFNEKCTIQLKEGAVPVVRPPRRVPISIMPKLESTLKQLEHSKIITKVSGPITWASNLVIVEKPNGQLRICLDPAELNKNIQKEPCLIPTVTEVCSKLMGKSWFTVLDLKDGFYHIELDDNSSKLCTFSTPFGFYRF